MNRKEVEFAFKELELTDELIAAKKSKDADRLVAAKRAVFEFRQEQRANRAAATDGEGVANPTPKNTNRKVK